MAEATQQRALRKLQQRREIRQAAANAGGGKTETSGCSVDRGQEMCLQGGVEEFLPGFCPDRKLAEEIWRRENRDKQELARCPL